MLNAVSEKITADRRQLKGALILLFTAFVWGTSFVSQSIGSKSIEPFTFMGLRTFLGAVVLVPFIVFRRKKHLVHSVATLRNLIVSGIMLGVVLAVACDFQQAAFYYCSAGKIAFITASYMLMVPLIRRFSGVKIRLNVVVAVIIGFVGLYFLSIHGKEDFALSKGDIYSFFSAVFYAVQILLIEKFVENCDAVELSCVQFASAGLFSLALMLVFEHPTAQGVIAAAPAVIYSGVLSCGLAYTLQTIAQGYCESSVASLVMCMESVFAALSSAVILSERMSGSEITGCIIMMVAVVLSQLNFRKKNMKLQSLFQNYF